MKPRTEFTDTERLDWLIKNRNGIGFRSNNVSKGFIVQDGLARFTNPGFPTAREAIDDAMRREGV